VIDGNCPCPNGKRSTFEPSSTPPYYTGGCVTPPPPPPEIEPEAVGDKDCTEEFAMYIYIYFFL